MFFWRRVASQIPEDDLKPTATPGYMRNFRDLNHQISQGKSFSGYERNPLFLNLRGRGFAEIAHPWGIDFDDDARAVAIQDWDRDGDLDLWVTNRTAPRVRLLQNRHVDATRAAGLSIRLVGNGENTNRDAIGARLTLTSRDPDEAPQIRSVRAGDGFLAQSSAWIHFGLGKTAGDYQLQVDWPGGATESFVDLQAGGRYLIAQSQSGRPEALASAETPPLSLPPSPESESVPAPEGESGFWVAKRVPFPRLVYEDAEGRERSTRDFAGRPVLVNFWATWCAPCIRELAMFSQHAEELTAQNATVLALNVDGLAVNGGSVSQASPGDVLRGVGFPFAHGIARQEGLEMLEILIEFLSSKRTPLSIPTSFLLDARGDVAAVYLEPVTWQRVQDDLALLDAPWPEQRARLTPRPGRWFSDPRQSDRSTLVKALATRLARGGFPEESQRLYQEEQPEGAARTAHDAYNQAKAAAEQGNSKVAIAAYREALRLDLAYGEALTGLGALLLQQKQPDDARELFERALQLDPNHATALVNLATIDQSQGDSAAALQRLIRVVDRNPDYVAARLNLGSLLASLERFEEAIPHLVKAASLQPESLPAHLSLATAYLQSAQWTEADGHFRKALALQPRLGYAHEGLAESLADRGRHQEAINAYRQAVTLGRRTPKVFTGLGQAYQAIGEGETAREAYQIALKMDPDHAPAQEALRALESAPGN